MKLWAKMYKIRKYFEKGQPRVCNYRTHKAARICPDLTHEAMQKGIYI